MYISMDEGKTVVSACTLYSHLQQYCCHPLICLVIVVISCEREREKRGTLNCTGKRNSRYSNIDTVMGLIEDPVVANYKDVCLQNTSESHSHHLKYGIYYNFIDR